MSPITKASGTKRVVLARYARNRRLGDALLLQAYSALRSSPGARAFYDRQRARGATHYQALRALANRLVGILHGCLRHHTRYDEHRAWHTADQESITAADVHAKAESTSREASHRGIPPDQPIPPERSRGQPAARTRPCRPSLTAASTGTPSDSEESRP